MLDADARYLATIEDYEAIERMEPIVEAARTWADARSAFINLPMGSPDARRLLNSLSEAENNLVAAIRAERDKS